MYKSVGIFIFFTVLGYCLSWRPRFLCVCVTPPLPTEGARPECITLEVLSLFSLVYFTDLRGE